MPLASARAWLAVVTSHPTCKSDRSDVRHSCETRWRRAHAVTMMVAGRCRPPTRGTGRRRHRSARRCDGMWWHGALWLSCRSGQARRGPRRGCDFVGFGIGHACRVWHECVDVVVDCRSGAGASSRWDSSSSHVTGRAFTRRRGERGGRLHGGDCPLWTREPGSRRVSFTRLTCQLARRLSRPQRLGCVNGGTDPPRAAGAVRATPGLSPRVPVPSLAPLNPTCIIATLGLCCDHGGVKNETQHTRQGRRKARHR